MFYRTGKLHGNHKTDDINTFAVSLATNYEANTILVYHKLDWD